MGNLFCLIFVQTHIGFEIVSHKFYDEMLNNCFCNMFDKRMIGHSKITLAGFSLGLFTGGLINLSRHITKFYVYLNLEGFDSFLETSRTF
jgi:hypothetical protein